MDTFENEDKRKKLIIIAGLGVLLFIVFLFFYNPVNIASGQKLFFYQEVLKKLFEKETIIPSYAVNEDLVYFVSYENNRKLKNIYKIQYNRHKNLKVSSFLDFKESYELYSSNGNRVSFKPFINESDYVPEPNQNLPHEQYKIEYAKYSEAKHLIKELKKLEYTFVLKAENTKGSFDSKLLSKQAEENFYNLLADFLNEQSLFDREKILSRSFKTLFDDNMLSKLEEIMKAKRQLSKYEKVYTINRVNETSKVHLSPNSRDYLINKKYSEISGKQHPHQIDNSCLVYEEYRKNDWSMVRIVSPDWLRHVRGWVPTKVLGKDITNSYYNELVMPNYYKPFNTIASEKLYQKFKNTNINIDSYVKEVTKDILINNFIKQGKIDERLFSAIILEESEPDNIIIKYHIGNSYYTHSSKTKAFEQL